MKPEDAFNALQRQELMHKFVEIGKVLLTWAILKNVDMVVQRVVFLHEELMKLPSFPRKALEADLDLYKGGEIGRVCRIYERLSPIRFKIFTSPRVEDSIVSIKITPIVPRTDKRTRLTNHLRFSLEFLCPRLY